MPYRRTCPSWGTCGSSIACAIFGCRNGPYYEQTPQEKMQIEELRRLNAALERANKLSASGQSLVRDET